MKESESQLNLTGLFSKIREKFSPTSFRRVQTSLVLHPLATRNKGELLRLKILKTKLQTNLQEDI